MVKKKKSAKKLQRRKAPIKKLSKKTIRKTAGKPLGARLKRIKGSARRYRDPRTGKTYSRRQYEKLRTLKPVPRKNAPEITRKYQKILTLRDIFISSQRKQGIKWTHKDALVSDEFRVLVKGLHSKDMDIRQAAWDEITGGDRAEWTPYIERWTKGEAA